MELFLCFSVITGITATLAATRKWIKKAPEVGLIDRDVNKPSRHQVPEIGGVSVVFGFVLGVLTYIGFQTFVMWSLDYLPILAALCAVLIACIIGIMDEVLGWKAGLQQWQKPIFMLFAAMLDDDNQRRPFNHGTSDLQAAGIGNPLSVGGSSHGHRGGLKRLQHGRRLKRPGGRAGNGNITKQRYEVLLWNYLS